jgi:putative ABC transport system permease protein
MNQILSALEISSILSLVTLAAVLTFRLAGFPDLSVDGVFSLGAVVFVRLALVGFAYPSCILAAICAGAAAGFFTAGTSISLKINPLLASVLVLTILYSINLRILGAPNQTLFNVAWWRPQNDLTRMYSLGGIAIVVVGLAYVFFSTEIGSALRSTGSAPLFLTAVGKNVAAYRAFLVAIAGALVSLAGSLLASLYGFADVSLGTGVVIIGIASVILGESVCGRLSWRRQLCAVPVGILLYESAVSVALDLGVSATDVKLATGLITLGLLAFARRRGEGLLA